MNARPDKQFRKAPRDRLPLKFVVGGEDPDSLGDVKVGENQKPFPVCGPLKQAGRLGAKARRDRRAGTGAGCSYRAGIFSFIPATAGVTGFLAFLCLRDRGDITFEAACEVHEVFGLRPKHNAVVEDFIGKALMGFQAEGLPDLGGKGGLPAFGECRFQRGLTFHSALILYLHCIMR